MDSVHKSQKEIQKDNNKEVEEDQGEQLFIDISQTFYFMANQNFVKSCATFSGEESGNVSSIEDSVDCVSATRKGTTITT